MVKPGQLHQAAPHLAVLVMKRDGSAVVHPEHGVQVRRAASIDEGQRRDVVEEISYRSPMKNRMALMQAASTLVKIQNPSLMLQLKKRRSHERVV